MDLPVEAVLVPVFFAVVEVEVEETALPVVEED